MRKVLERNKYDLRITKRGFLFSVLGQIWLSLGFMVDAGHTGALGKTC